MKYFRTFLIVVNLIMSAVNTWFFYANHHWVSLIGAVAGVVVAGMLYLSGKMTGDY